MQNFLRQVHPIILDTALDNMRHTLANGEQDGWGLSKWVTVWLAIPRGGAYAPVAEKWDDEVRNIKAFRQLNETGETTVSLKEIETSGAKSIYIVPNPIDSASVQGRKAISVLRARGGYLIQGLHRDGGFLANTPLTAGTTADLLLSQFRAKLPQIVNIEEVAFQLIRDEQTLADIFPTDPKVQLVRLGAAAAPVARIGGSLWINAGSSARPSHPSRHLPAERGLPGSPCRGSAARVAARRRSSSTPSRSDGPECPIGSSSTSVSQAAGQLKILVFAGAGTSVELGVPAMRAMVVGLREHFGSANSLQP